MRALAAEAKKAGLKFCFYYSIMDWHHPSQYVEAPGKDPTAGDGKTKMREGRKPEYVAYMKAQLQGAGHQVRPGGPLVRRRVGGLVDRGGRPGSLRLRPRA